MTVLAWVTLIASAIVGGAIGALIGFYYGRKNATQAVVTASRAAEVKAETTATAERDAINAQADAQLARLPTETPAQAVDDLEHLP